MNQTPTLRELENLSALLDGQIPPAQRARLVERLRVSDSLSAALADFRQLRNLLRRVPTHRAPRNFLLTPRMAGVRPPAPRLVPVFSWASAFAMLFFFCTLGTNLAGRFSFGAASAPMALSEPSTSSGDTAGSVLPTSEMAVENYDPSATATPELLTLMVPLASPLPEERVIAPEAIPPADDLAKSGPTLDPWLLVWPGLAAAFLLGAGLLRWLGLLSFRRRAAKKS